MSSATDVADEVQASIVGELRLHDPAVRRSRADAERLLDPEFVEVGKSGRRWNREEMLADLPEFETSSDTGPRIEASHMAGVLLAEDTLVLTPHCPAGEQEAFCRSLCAG